MTNVSNYGPVRRLSPPVSADNRKPYSRTGLKGVLGTLDLNSGDAVVPPTLDSPYYPFHVETPQLEAPTQNRFTVPDGSRDIPGFPTYEQYVRIEEEYLSSLSERKQPKALISQSLFDKIYAVLQNGSEDRASTAQFRFWVRKMFVLAYPQTSFNHNTTSQSPEPVVLHDKRAVAIKERLYEVLCYCHAIARHGGRDKTCATLRLHYSWVPKELTAKFVKACPTCTLKRSGNPDLLSQFNYAAPPYLPTAPEPASLINGGPNDSSPGLNFTGSSVCDNNNNNNAATAAAGSSASSFAPSIFATPDLSVYPSPTLSTGSGGGPMTPSPYLHGGLFGYPAVFDPGHSSSLSSVAGWDPSPSPCVPAYGGGSDETQPSSSANDDSIDARPQHSLHLHLPTPKNVSRFAHSSNDHSSSSSGSSTYRYASERVEQPTPPPCVLDGNIDPALFIEGFPTPGPARRTDAPWETPTGAFGIPNFHLLLHMPAPSSSRSASPPRQLHAGAGGMMFAPVPMGIGRMRSVLCGMQEMDAEEDMDPDAEGRDEVEVTAMRCRQERWESPEAWLVPSDSADDDEADGYH